MNSPFKNLNHTCTILHHWEKCKDFFFFIKNEQWGRCWVNPCLWLAIPAPSIHVMNHVITWKLLFSISRSESHCVFYSKLPSNNSLHVILWVRLIQSTWVLSNHPDRHRYTGISWYLQTDNTAAVWHTSTKKALEGVNSGSCRLNPDPKCDQHLA